MMDAQSVQARLETLGSSLDRRLYSIHSQHHNGISATCGYCSVYANVPRRSAPIFISGDSEVVWLDAEKNAPDPKCNLCGDKAPFGDARNYWIGYHHSWYHKLYCVIKRFFLV